MVVVMMMIVMMTENDADGIGHGCDGNDDSVGDGKGICGDSRSGD